MTGCRTTACFVSWRCAWLSIMCFDIVSIDHVSAETNIIIYELTAIDVFSVESSYAEATSLTSIPWYKDMCSCLSSTNQTHQNTVTTISGNTLVLSCFVAEVQRARANVHVLAEVDVLGAESSYREATSLTSVHCCNDMCSRLSSTNQTHRTLQQRLVAPRLHRVV